MTTTTLFTHHVALQLTRKLTSQDLLTHIQTTKVILLEEAIERVRNSFNKQNSEVLATSTKLSLLDPLLLSRIIAPGRAYTCRHLQCFDLENYLLMNERIRRWICPVCDQPAIYQDLQYDSYFSSILEDLKSDLSATSVILSPDGKWALDTPKAQSTISVDAQPLSVEPPVSNQTSDNLQTVEIINTNLNTPNIIEIEEDVFISETSNSAHTNQTESLGEEGYYIQTWNVPFIYTPMERNALLVGGSIESPILLSDSDD